MREVVVKVVAGARRERVLLGTKYIEVHVKEPAQDNRANNRVIQLIALHFGVPAVSVRLIRGHHSSKKTFTVPASLK